MVVEMVPPLSIVMKNLRVRGIFVHSEVQFVK